MSSHHHNISSLQIAFTFLLTSNTHTDLQLPYDLSKFLIFRLVRSLLVIEGATLTSLNNYLVFYLQKVNFITCQSELVNVQLRVNNRTELVTA